VLSGLVLFLTALAKLYGATGNAKVFLVGDPLIHINNRVLMILLGIVETCVACCLMRAYWPERHFRAASVLLWLSSNFLAYRLGRFVLGVKVCPCLGTLSEKLPLDATMTTALLGTLALMWFLGSFVIVRATRQWAHISTFDKALMPGPFLHRHRILQKAPPVTSSLISMATVNC